MALKRVMADEKNKASGGMPNVVRARTLSDDKVWALVSTILTHPLARKGGWSELPSHVFPVKESKNRAIIA
jgi:hypothetical protein